MKEAEEVIATLEIRKEDQKYPAELIPIRLSEIYLVNESYEWTVSMVKQELKKDFQGVEEDLEKLQQVIDSGKIGPKKKEEWMAIGITFCRSVEMGWVAWDGCPWIAGMGRPRFSRNKPRI